jgi:hypothetical protein
VSDNLKVRVFPYRPKVGMGNILWPGKFKMNGGKFPKSHPVGGGLKTFTDGQFGESEGMAKFRERGYWASCFPEGDGITWKPENGQSDAQCLSDIRECFGWDAQWDKNAPVQP